MLTPSRLLVAAALIVPASLCALAGWLNWQRIETDTKRHTEQTAAAFAEHALRTLRAHELTIDLVDSHVRGWSWADIRRSPELHEVLARLRGKHRDISSIFLVDPAGQTAASSRRFPMPDMDMTDRDYFRAAKEGEELFVSPPSHGRLANDLFFSVSRPRGDGDPFDGLIAVSVDPAYFAEFYRSMLEPAEVATLVRADGTMLVREPFAPDLAPVLPASSGFMKAVAVNEDGGSFVARSLVDEGRRLIAYRRVGDYPVYTTFSYSLDAMGGEWREAMIPFLLASLLAAGGMLVAIALAEQRTRRALAEQRQHDAETASEAKDRFVAMLGHEIRNPLASIAYATEALKMSPRSPEAEAQAIDIIGRQAAQMGTIVDDLLDTARAIYGKLKLERQVFDLRAMLDELIAERRLRHADLQFDLSLDGAGQAPIDADPARARQMLDNLLENAVRYGGRRIAVRLTVSAQACEVNVTDDGEGIAPELLPRLFEPFVQGEQSLDRPGGGLGLGLALVQRLARLHGATLVAHSDGVGRGSTFTLRFPRAHSPMAGPKAQPATGTTPRRVVLIEDDADARETMRTLLAAAGHDVRTASDGASGLALIAGQRPDAALIDLGLPQMDGFEVARRVRELPGGSAIRLLAVSGYGQERDRERARDAGFDAHLTKPCSFAEISRQL